ncbi:MAG: PIN domain-containing protein [Deltaproteobacteria bacterium]|nr:PIN domain-containing protein [Deltaproteobacteria bacterium]
MSVRSFLDSNILVYTDDADEPARQRRSLELVEEARLSGTGVVSTQVLQEYFVVTTRKLGVDPEIAAQKVRLFSRLPVVVIDVPDIEAAIDLQRLHRVSFWDALILRAAQRGSCAVLYSEDLQNGATLGGVRIENPFASGRRRSRSAK